ncbi:MAG: hypothetical protein WD073_06540 [Xanthobacteraceae bacterium]
MTTGVRYFFDVPVYRLAENEYYSKRQRYIEDVLFPANDPYRDALLEIERKDPNANIGFREHLARVYGGCWRYNEIIGYIRLHFLGSQIRGEYFSVRKKRIVRTRNKTLEYRTWKIAPEIDIPDGASSTEIFKLIMEYVEDCRKELKGRYIDVELLQTLSPWIDWRGLYLS